MVVKAVYLGFVIRNLVLITAFRFQVSAFRLPKFSISVWLAPSPRKTASQPSKKSPQFSCCRPRPNH
jgi:hypothetical protein